MGWDWSAQPVVPQGCLAGYDCQAVIQMPASCELPPKADTARCDRDIRFVPVADIAAPSFDHFVGADKQSGWHSEAERLHLPPDTIEVLDVSVALVGLAVFLTMFAALPTHTLKWKERPRGDAVPPQNMAPANRARPLDRDCLASNAAARALRA